ncbi:MAG: YfhO family protein, partial [Bacilli bacterium]|nr:YfhO family protein [Bacilli bacterium]
MKRKTLIILTVLIIPLIIILVFKQMGLLYGSQTDWISQHIVIADYFRSYFYETGHLFPDLSLNIGAGQNIFNFAYYGLLSPIILISYLLPFVEMSYYIAYTSLLAIIISFILIRKWFLNNGYSKKISLIVAILFLLAGPIIYHTHRHIMFINYFPFLILGLMGIDKYYHDKKPVLLIISTFLIIITSYYYSVMSIATLGLYALYKYLKNNETINPYKLINYLLKNIFYILIGIIMAAFLLLPLINIILTSRNDIGLDVSILDLLTPNVDVSYFLYDSYSLGFSVIFIISILYGFLNKKKENIILSLFFIIITIIPIFIYILNGGLYIRAKVLIPLIPVALLLVADFLKIAYFKNVKIYFFLLTIVGIICKCDCRYYLDIVILWIFFSLRNKNMVYFLLLIVPFINLVVVNYNDSLVSISDYNKYNSGGALIKQVINADDSYYRFNNLNNTMQNINKIYNSKYYATSIYSSTYNSFYYNFYYNVFNNAFEGRNIIMTATTDNILFQTYMGVKYVMTTDENLLGYSLIANDENNNIYQNNNVFPLGYVTSKIINTSDFEELTYPYTVSAIMSSAITDDNTNYDFVSSIEEINLDYELVHGDDLLITNYDDNVEINALNKASMIINLEEAIDNQILMIEFNLKEAQTCSEGDLSITINGIKNTLTCEDWIYSNNNYTFSYVVSSSEPINNLVVSFSKGLYKIADLKTYVWDYDDVVSLTNEIDKFNIETIDSNSTITGNIDVSKSGYFILTIPYDEGFTIKVDG